jgi:abortive infection bacteriophage resistance protein
MENNCRFYLSENSYTPTKGNNDKLSKQKNVRYFEGFLKDIQNNEQRIRTDTARYPEVKEMRPKGEGENALLPAEVYFHYIDLGDICPIYSYLRGDLRKEVLRYGYTRKNYGKETTKQFDTWLEAVRNLRNFCAHHFMLVGKASCVIIPEFGEDYIVSSKTDLFSRLYALKKILPEDISGSLKCSLQALLKSTDIDALGLGILPRDWEEKFDRIKVL